MGKVVKKRETLATISAQIYAMIFMWLFFVKFLPWVFSFISQPNWSFTQVLT